MSHTSSRVWVSDSTREMELWHSKTTLLRHFLGKNCQRALVPWSWLDWLKHREAVSNAKITETKANLQRITLRRALRKQGIYKPAPAFGGKIPRGNRGSVLAQETVWCEEWSVPARAGAEIWPSLREQQYEGDERAQKQFGRVLPLLRARDPHDAGDLIEYSRHLPRVFQHSFDNIDPIDRLMRDWPFREEAMLQHQPVQQIDDESAALFLSIELLKDL